MHKRKKKKHETTYNQHKRKTFQKRKKKGKINGRSLGAICWFSELGCFFNWLFMYELDSFRIELDLIGLKLCYNELDSNWLELDCISEVP